jgi:hypothetical protein
VSGSTKNSAGAGDDATGMARVDIDPIFRIPSSVEVLGVFRKNQRIQYPPYGLEYRTRSPPALTCAGLQRGYTSSTFPKPLA